MRERAGLLAALHLAIARGWDRAAANIAIDWRPMNQLVDADAYTFPHAQAALAAAEHTGDPLLRAELHRDVGPKASHLGDVAAGQRHLEQARTIYAQLGDRVGEANVLRNLSASPAVSADVALDHLRIAINLVLNGKLHRSSRSWSCPGRPAPHDRSGGEGRRPMRASKPSTCSISASPIFSE